MRALLAAGGTGGHMFPAQALSEELARMGWSCAMITDARGMKLSGNIKADPIIEVKAASISPRKPVQALRGAAQLAVGVRQAKAFMREWKPDVVVGFGGYPSFPALRAAEGLNIPRVIHEQNTVLGRANRVFARKATVVASGFEDLAKLPVGANHVVVGNPVRDAVLQASRLKTDSLLPEGEGARRADEGNTATLAESEEQPPYAPHPPLRGTLSLGERGVFILLVVGGSLGAERIATTVPQAVSQLPKRMLSFLKVIQQTPDRARPSAEQGFGSAGVVAVMAPFFPNIEDHLARADLVIARAGASSVAEIALMGKPAIFIPLAIAMDDHQTANARALERRGAAKIVPESEFTVDAFARLLEDTINDTDWLDQAGAIAQSLARPDAARDLAALVVQAAQ